MPKSLLPPFPRLLPLLFCLCAPVFAVAAHAQAQQPRQAAVESLPELVRRVKPSVVAIVTYDAKGEPLLSGSGFFIRPGQVLTNLHVVEGARRVEVKTLDGKGRIYASRGALDFDEEADLAVLSVDVPHERTRVIELTTNLPEEGEGVFVIGNPLRLEGSVSDGIVSAVREVPNLGKIIQTTAPISHGNSGSPIFNYRGQVVGIVTVKVTNGQNINLALASARLASLKPDKLTTYDALAARNRALPGGEASAEWWYKNGLNSLWLGNYDGALGSFEQVVNKNPARVEAWIQVGYCKVKQGKMSDAIRAYKQALRLRPNSVEAYNKLGDAYYYASNFGEAIAAYRQAARLRPDLGEAFYNLGMTYLEIGDHSAALDQSRLLRQLDAELYQKLINEFRR
ncbi:MAG TPA: trypsin-like peptidase domain-containing protein [Pyrinomonadaceae bacterium]|nr:trypsin-like peptidase domain-containing protein [Pyrinomonadaceae bacterium]